MTDPIFEQPPEQPGLEPLTRTQILVAMGATAALLLAAAKGWQYASGIAILPVTWSVWAGLLGSTMGMAIAFTSTAIYRLWPGYRRSADTYLHFVLDPLVLPDLIWLGLLPGISEELLFRGVLLPFFGGKFVGVAISSVLFGVSHLLGKNQWPYAIWATVVGAVFGIGGMLTGNLLVPIVAHATTNIISAGFWKLDATRDHNSQP